MSGYNLIKQIHKLEEDCDQLGFMLCHSRHGTFNHEFGDVVAVKPKDVDSLPIYARDAELFCGTITELGHWLRGIRWAREYDDMLFGKKHQGNRVRKKQDVRNRRLVSILKE